MRRLAHANIAILFAASAVNAVELTESRYDELLESLRPKPTELWRTIPWKISLVEAQNAATKANKPIFIWAMDGHPLGCT